MIKSLHIHNFKSFLDEKIEKFSNRINLIIGKNGQGKSNFYSAFKFVFSVEAKDKVT